MTPINQIKAIRKMGRRRLPQRLKWVLVALSIVIGAAALYTRQPPYLMALVFVAFVTYSAFQTAPHIEAAARALTAANRVDGSVIIEVVEAWSDSNTYHVVIPVAPYGAWRFEFIPGGWKPIAGESKATIYWLADIVGPALVQVEAGVMYPRHTPTWRTKESGV